MNKKKTYKLQLPKDVNVDKAHLRIHDGQIVVDVEFKEEIKPKDGDFLVNKYGKVFIYSKKNPDNSFVYSAYCGVRMDDVIRIDFSNMWTLREGCRFATQEEKSAFLERLEKECHKTWNAEKKQLEDIRWRPEEGEPYFFIDKSFNVDCIRYLHEYDCGRIETNNCFKTKEAAQPYADKFKDMLKQSKAE